MPQPDLKLQRPEISFKPNFGQITLGLCCLIVLLSLTVSTFSASRTAFQEASILSKAEAPAASLIFTQRESLVYATKVGEWLGGTLPRRDVQIARALLAQRMSVVNYDGTSTGQLATPEFIASLKGLDHEIDNAPPGILPENDHEKYYKSVHPYLEDFIAAARDVVVQYQQAIDIQLKSDARDRAHSSQRNLFLLYSFFILGAALVAWIGISLVRQFRRARLQIAEDTETLEQAERQLQDLTRTLEEKRIADQMELDSRTSMRYASREISISIREFSDQNEMATNFCSRVGEVFRADCVQMATFQDERVSLIKSEWTNPNFSSLPINCDLSQDYLLQIITLLWEESSLLYLDATQPIQEHPAERAGMVKPFIDVMHRNGFDKLLLLPIGEGTKAFGYVLLGSSGDAIEWDEYNRQALQFLCAHLAYSIVESELLATQRVVEKLEELNDTKNDFISTVNHELRTPLTSIIGYIDLLKDLPKNEVSQQAAIFLNTLDRNAQALLDLVESMLSLSRLDSSEKSFPKLEVDILKLIKSTIFVLEPTAASRDINLRLDFTNPDQKYLVSGDSGQLSQVFINLISNAIKFSYQNSDVIVSLAHSRNSDHQELVEITVQDFGIGIATEDQDQLFTRFFRGHNAIEQQLPGTGLGLAIVDRIISLHDGHIDVQSQLGQGTTMKVTIPALVNKVDALIEERKRGVLERAIAAVESAPRNGLYEVAHEMAGAIGMYSFESEGEELRDFSHWIRKNPEAQQDIVSQKLDPILHRMKVRLEEIQKEGVQ